MNGYYVYNVIVYNAISSSSQTLLFFKIFWTIFNRLNTWLSVFHTATGIGPRQPLYNALSNILFNQKPSRRINVRIFFIDKANC